MNSVNLPQKRAIEQEQSEILQQLENWLETPMLVLSILSIIPHQFVQSSSITKR